MKLKILTWNISYGYGLDSEGTRFYEQRPPEHFESALNSMSDVIQQQGVDIALLQEVDFDSARSHHVNQLAYLARRSGLFYRNELVSWDFPYVPYPGLNPKNQFGKVVSGGGIISRFPIETVLHEKLPKPKENSKLYNLFYLYRYLQIVKIQNLNFMNLHLEAFSMENRELHLVKMQDRLADFDITVAGGDFNGHVSLLPQFETGWTAFPSPTPTFPSNEPVETLDAFVTKNKLAVRASQIQVLNTGTTSDHFPLFIELDVE
jgi:endonuclease/exonuclease/phosphatase family metal-dependent hydrolase